MDWISAFKKLRVDRTSKTPAPHKAILLLVLIDQIEKGLLNPHRVELTPQLAFQFLSYWEVIAHRGRAIGRIELPYFYLQSDGLLRHVAKPGLEPVLRTIRPTSVSALNAVIDYSEMPLALFEFLASNENRRDARVAILQGDWFLNEEKFALGEMLHLPTERVEEPPSSSAADYKVKAVQSGREARFRLTIIPLYRYTCALCSLKMLTPSGLTVVEAAHIHQFAESRNNDPNNGIALCRNHHWAFDAGLWSMDDSFRVVVAHAFLEETSPFPNTLFHFTGKTLDFSWIDISLRPNLQHMHWHRYHRFLG